MLYRPIKVTATYKHLTNMMSQFKRRYIEIMEKLCIARIMYRVFDILLAQ